LEKDKYFVSEIFRSIQGEGNFAGVNCLFIRFQFCNLTCSWCDTKYTWLRKSGSFKEYSKEELKKVIEETPCHHIIFTGGEPTLYRLDELAVTGKKFHVETNGTIIPWEQLNITLVDCTIFTREAMDVNIIKNFNWVISPKLSNSGQPIQVNSLKSWIEKDLGIFKFIITDEKDLEEVSALAIKYSVSKDRIYIGLEGTNINNQIKPDLVDKIIEAGFNFSPRLHVMLWGATKGK
jgi:organic radical activating enzyme